jgi:predicted Zn-dependent protease with MMP-like domain
MIMNREQFEKYVLQAIDELPDYFREKLNNVDIVVEPVPSSHVLKSLNMNRNSLLLGLYQGVPMTKRSSHYRLVLPDKRTLFQTNIERVYGNEKSIVMGIRDTLLHEIAHHFGMNEKQIREIEKTYRKPPGQP